MAILRKDGTAHIRLIAPGQGSSGFYPAETLKRAAPKFREAQMFWDHAPEAELARFPAGSLRNLAGKIVGTPVYEERGKIGPGLYADVKVYEPYQKTIESMGSDIGVSIHAAGRPGEREIEGKKVTVIEDITAARSVDWVTRPGAGGRAVELFEAARSNHPAPVAEKPKEGPTMETWEIEAREAALKASEDRIKQLEESVARANEREQLREAEDLVRRTLEPAELHHLYKSRIAADVLRTLPLTEAGVIDQDKLVEAVREGVKREANMIAAVTGSGRIAGMGASGELGYPEDQVKAAQARLEESFKRGGMTPEMAAIAARGRRS